MSVLLADALGYLDRDWSVIPVIGKRPTIRKVEQYFETAASATTIRKWFASPRPNGVAVVCGPVSCDLVVMDFDESNIYSEWRRTHPTLARELPTSQTTKGYHVHFRFDLQYRRKVLGGDLLGRGYVLMPPSKPNGFEHRWLVPLLEGELPWLDPFEVGLAVELTEGSEVTDGNEGTEVKDTEARVWGGDLTAYADDIEHAIRTTLPKAKAQRNDLLIFLASALKGIEALEHAPADALEPVVREWHRLALPIIGTKPFTLTWAEFVRAWGNCKYPKGTVMRNIIEQAEATEPPTAALKYDCPKMRLLASICRELGRQWEGQPFPLPCRKAGEWIGTNYQYAADYILLLKHDGLLKLEVPHTRTRAARYRYIA